MNKKQWFRLYYLLNAITLVLYFLNERSDSLFEFGHRFDFLKILSGGEVPFLIIFSLLTLVLIYRSPRWGRLLYFCLYTIFISVNYNTVHQSYDVRVLNWFWCHFFSIFINDNERDEEFLPIRYINFIQLCWFYVVAGVWKVILLNQANSSGKITALVPNILLCSTDLLNESYLFSTSINPFLGHHPYVGFTFYIFIILSQMSFFIIPFIKKSYPFAIVYIVIFHILNHMVLGLNFTYHFIPVVFYSWSLYREKNNGFQALRDSLKKTKTV